MQQSSSGFSRAHGPAQSIAGLRVIIVLGPLELGGSERQALLFGRYLKEKQRVDVQVWGTMGQPGRVAALCDEYGIPWRIVPEPWVIGRAQRAKALAKFAWRLRQSRPDVILPYMWQPSLVCSFVWPWTGARLCLWNQRDHGLTRMNTRYERWAIRFAPGFIANSEYVANYLIQELGANPKQVRVVRNGIELIGPEADRQTWRGRLGISNDCFLVCMVANLHKDKDHSTLLRAWRIVVDRMKEIGREVVLLLAGRFDATYEDLKALARDLELDESIRFLGPVSDIAGLLGAIDLGVFSSRSEGSPNGVLECMATGLAVVCTDIPAIREAMTREAQSCLVPISDSEAMANAIVRLLVDEGLRRRLGEINRQHVETYFSKQQMCETMLQVILDGLNGRTIREFQAEGR
jgi:glycosyltransferase involved in cell wall biosynthesis